MGKLNQKNPLAVVWRIFAMKNRRLMFEKLGGNVREKSFYRDLTSNEKNKNILGLLVRFFGNNGWIRILITISRSRSRGRPVFQKWFEC